MIHAGFKGKYHKAGYVCLLQYRFLHIPHESLTETYFVEMTAKKSEFWNFYFHI